MKLLSFVLTLLLFNATNSLGALTISNIVNDPSGSFSTFDANDGGLVANMRVDLAGGSATMTASANASSLGPIRLLVITTQTVPKTVSMAQVGGTGTAVFGGGSFHNVSPLDVSSDVVLTVDENSSGLVVGGGGSPPASGTEFSGTSGGSGILKFSSSTFPTFTITQPLVGNQFTDIYIMRTGSVIPEPSSALLLLTAVCSLFVARRR